MKRAAGLLSLLLTALILLGGSYSRATAQDGSPTIQLAQADRGQRPNIFRFLFRDRRQRVIPAPQQRQILVPRRQREAAPQRRQREAARPRRQREAARPRRERRARPAAPAPREVEAVEKAENAKRVLVIGDFMATALSKGLADTFAENANLLVIDATSGASGLVRSDYYDWTKELPALVGAQKPDAIVVMVGANDRQPIATEAGNQALGSEGWRMAYGARITALADAAKASGKPVLWAGLAPVRASAMSGDYSEFNGIARERLEGTGVRFVDVWNGFADEEGRFVAEGPDIKGQPVQLRNSDGLNFTRAGQLKLAFFLERELSELLGGAAPQLAAIDPTATGLPAAPGETAPQIGPMIPLDALSAAGGEALSGSPAGAPPAGAGLLAPPPALPAIGPAAAAQITESLAGQGAAVPPSGRADDFSWPIQ